MPIFSEAKCKTARLLAAGWALSGLTDISHKKSQHHGTMAAPRRGDDGECGQETLS